MSNDAKLQKLNLGPDWIDLSFGEPKSVMTALFRQLNRAGSPFKMPNFYEMPNWEYQPAAGKPDLVKILEKKYGTKVVVCNGAKQALAAALYAFKRREYRKIHFRSPYYPATPGLVESSGLLWADEGSADSFLVTSPGNPDGHNYSNLDLITARHAGPTIHDAAYYTEIYLPDGQTPLPLGHIQVFSVSKMYGLSGVRVGYAVAHDESFYQDMVDYMEMTTAGVSVPAQDVVRNIEIIFRDNPDYYREFVSEARASLIASRKELSGLDPDVLELMPSQCNSMFAWFKAGPALDNKSAKVHILPGELFGQPGMIRMNIAQPTEMIREAVSRLNQHKIRS